MTIDALKNMAKVSVEDNPSEVLCDISNLPIDRTKPVESRIMDFIGAVGNPYLFRVGDMAVKVQFASNGKPLVDAVVNILATS